MAKTFNKLKQRLLLVYLRNQKIVLTEVSKTDQDPLIVIGSTSPSQEVEKRSTAPRNCSSSTLWKPRKTAPAQTGKDPAVVATKKRIMVIIIVVVVLIREVVFVVEEEEVDILVRIRAVTKEVEEEAVVVEEVGTEEEEEVLINDEFDIKYI